MSLDKNNIPRWFYNDVLSKHPGTRIPDINPLQITEMIQFTLFQNHAKTIWERETKREYHL